MSCSRIVHFIRYLLPDLLPIGYIKFVNENPENATEEQIN